MTISRRAVRKRVYVTAPINADDWSMPGPRSPSQPANTTEEINANNHAGSCNPLFPAIFPIRVDKLRNIATASFASSLMQYRLELIRERRGDHHELYLLRLLLVHQAMSKTDFVSLLTSVEKSTIALIPIMYDSFDVWKKYHHRMIFWDLDSCEDILLGEWLDEIVWMSDGSINYGQTAEKMLNSGKMIDIKKYRLACVYCFEDSVRNLGSKLGHKRLKLDLEQHSEYWAGNLLFDYWYSIIRPNDCDSSFEELDDDLPYKGHFIVKKLILYHEDNFNAIEYLWNTNDGRTEDRMRMQKKTGDRCNPLYTWRVLIDLNASEFDVVIEEDGTRILQCFAKDSRFEEVAITIWRYMLDRIVNDDKLARNFIAARGENNHKIFDAEHEPHLIQLMWHYVPERLRPAIFNAFRRRLAGARNM